MANTKSAIKQIRVADRKRRRNQPVRTRAKTEIKKVRVLVEDGKLDEAQTQTQEAIRVLDRAASKGVIHRNNAARRKSRLMKQLNKAHQGE